MSFKTYSRDPRYRISDAGVVVGPQGKPLKLQNKDGYLRFCAGYGVSVRVHRAVAELFVPNPEHLPEVNHVNGDKTDNRAVNLEWSTRKGNMTHAFSSGLATVEHGEESPRAILSQEDVDYIRRVCVPRHPEFSQTALGRKFGVSNSTIHCVVHGKNWG